MTNTKKETRNEQIKRVNESSHIINMTPIWKDRHNRRKGKPSVYDHSLKSRIEEMKEMARD